MYLLFTNEEDAWSRSEQEGISLNLSYHTGTGVSRYVTAPKQTVDGQWALDVEGYDLDEIEQSTITEEVTFPEPQEEE